MLLLSARKSLVLQIYVSVRDVNPEISMKKKLPSCGVCAIRALSSYSNLPPLQSPVTCRPLGFSENAICILCSIECLERVLYVHNVSQPWDSGQYCCQIVTAGEKNGTAVCLDVEISGQCMTAPVYYIII